MTIINTIYKLTDADGRTFGGTQWDEGIEHRASGAGWLHAYEHPLLAVLHNPIHGNFQPDTMRLWEAETEDENPRREGYMKMGVRHLRIVKEIPVPVVTAEQRVRYAILCAMEVYRGPMWMAWAEGWLSGRDRSEVAAWAAVTKVQEEAQATMRAEAAVRAAAAAADAVWIEAAVAVRAAKAAADAVWMEAEMAAWAGEQSANLRARAAQEAAAAAAAVAAWAAVTARAAVRVVAELNLPCLAEQAMAEDKP